MRKMLTVFTSVGMVALGTLIPAPVALADTVPTVEYLSHFDNNQNPKYQTAHNCEVVTASTTKLATSTSIGKCWIVNTDTTVANRIEVTGDGVATLIIDNAKLDAQAGINLGPSAQLLVTQAKDSTTSSLKVRAPERFAGIGSAPNMPMGPKLQVFLKSVDIEGGKGAAGIGSGSESDIRYLSVHAGGTIRGGEGAAAIGAGEKGSFKQAYVAAFEDEILYAIGGKGGAGIGSGRNSLEPLAGPPGPTKKESEVFATGTSIIVAKGGENAAGIGKGYNAKGTVNFGTRGAPAVIAMGGSGAKNISQDYKYGWGGVILEGIDGTEGSSYLKKNDKGKFETIRSLELDSTKALTVGSYNSDPYSISVSLTIGKNTLLTNKADTLLVQNKGKLIIEGDVYKSSKDAKLVNEGTLVPRKLKNPVLSAVSDTSAKLDLNESNAYIDFSYCLEGGSCQSDLTIKGLTPETTYKVKTHIESPKQYYKDSDFVEFTTKKSGDTGGGDTGGSTGGDTGGSTGDNSGGSTGGSSGNSTAAKKVPTTLAKTGADSDVLGILAASLLMLGGLMLIPSLRVRKH